MGTRTRGVVATAAVAVAVLALGGSGGAWAAGSASAVPSAWAAPSWCTPTVSGTVTAVGTGSFTLTEADGTMVTVTMTSSTTYGETGAAVPPTGVSTGEQVDVTVVPGTARHATSVTATRVLVVLTHVLGTVVSVGAGSFTVQLVGGLVVTVATGPTTVVRKAGVVQPGVTAGQYVTAYGAADPSDPGLLDAQFVVVSTPPVVHPTSTGVSGSWPLLTGTVSAVSAGDFTLTEADGTVVAVTTTASTTYGETGSPTAPSGVADGDQVRVRPVDGTAPSATTVTASRVVVVLTQVTGVVQSIGTGTFAVRLDGGLVLTVETTGTTVYAVDGASASGVAVGEKVTAYGAPDPSEPSQLIAQYVDLHPQPTSGGRPGGPGTGWSSGWPGAGSDGGAGDGGHPPSTGPSGTGPARTFLWGTVRSATGDDIVVVEPAGSTVTVVVSSTTRYDGPVGTADLAAVTAGAVVGVAGTSAGSTQVDALVVWIGGVPSSGDPGGRSASGTWGDTSGTPTTITSVPSSPGDGGTGGGSWDAGRGSSGPTPTTTPTRAPTASTATSTPSGGPGDPGGARPASGGGTGGVGDGTHPGNSGPRGTGPSGHWG